MKTEKRFVIVFAAIFVVWCVLCVLCSVFLFGQMREHNQQAMVQLIANLRTEKPEMTDTDILKALDGKSNTLDTDDTESMMKSFGLSEDEWTVKINQADSQHIMTLSVGCCLLCGVSGLAVFLFYMQYRKKRQNELANYLAQINNGRYRMALDSNTESVDSRLQNEIYKTIVTLREAAQRASQGKEELKTALSDISHQLKTPLTSVIIMTEILLDNPDLPPELRQEFLCDIHRSSKHISFLVQSLLTLSKLDADSIVMKKQNVPLSRVFADVSQNVEVIAELKGVSVTAKDNDITLACDKKWLCEALTNITKNCIEHTSENGEVRLCAETNKFYTKITVSDNGQGIDIEDLPHIFDRFYRGKNADENSVGIGLALAKTIIQKSGGIVRVDSEVGKGSVFTIKFYNQNV